MAKESDRQQQIAEHLEAIRSLQREQRQSDAKGDASPGGKERSWPPKDYYVVWHVLFALGLGAFAAGVSLMFNVIGAPLFGERPLELIRVYLTFPMGEEALSVEPGFAIFSGCLMYLFTGALYGVVFHLVMSTVMAKESIKKRFLVATLLGLGLWITNFYLILSWLQPVLQGDNWIVRMVPIAVGVSTHLIFAWTMYLGEQFGRYEPLAHTFSSPGGAEGGAQ